MKTTIKQFISLAIVICACVACTPSNSSESVTTQKSVNSVGGKFNNTALKVPMQDTIKAVIVASEAGGFDLAAQVRFPALSIYSPDGRLVGRIDSEDGLANYAETLAKASAGAPAMPGKHMPLEILNGVLKKFHKGSTGLDERNGLPTLVYWRPNVGCESSCPKFENLLDKSQRSDKEGFNLVRITIEN